MSGFAGSFESDSLTISFVTFANFFGSCGLGIAGTSGFSETGATSGFSSFSTFSGFLLIFSFSAFLRAINGDILGAFFVDWAVLLIDLSIFSMKADFLLSISGLSDFFLLNKPPKESP